MKQSLLWKLSKEGHYDSFILGTMHVKSERAFRRSEQLKMLISECEIFAAEYDLDVLQNEQSQEDMFIPDGLTISKLIRKSKFVRIRKILLKSFKLDLCLYERFLPLIIVNIISEAALGKDYKVPLDLYLWRIASEKGLVLEGIESYGSQVRILNKINLEDQLKMINSIARNPKKFRRSIHKMAALYEEEKITQLYKSGKKTLGKYKKLLLINRNYIMGARFEELSAESKAFFAVGAGHLAGKYGLLKILKEKGWKLKAI